MKLFLEFTNEDNLKLNVKDHKLFVEINGVPKQFYIYNWSQWVDEYPEDRFFGIPSKIYRQVTHNRIEAEELKIVSEQERKAQETVEKAKEALKAAEAALKAVKEKE